MHARSWLVLTAICTLVCTSGCGSARWGSRHSRLRGPNACVESSCDDPTCEICSPLPPLYDGMARNHRLNRRALRHGRHAHSRHGFAGGGCSCGHCGGEWFEGEIIEGEIIGGDGFGGCSSCMSGDGMIIDGGMSMGMSSGCSTCGQHVMHDGSMPHSSMMPGQTFESHGEPQPTPAAPRSSVPSGSPAAPPSSSVPGDMHPASPMPPMNPPMEPASAMRAPNYGAALFGSAPSEPQPYTPAPTSQPIIHEQAMPMHEGQPPAPPLASPAAHSAPVLMAPPSMPTFPGEVSGAPQPSDYYSPKDSPTPAPQSVLMQPNPIQLQSASIPAAAPGKKPMRPFSEAAKPRQPATQAAPPQLPPLTQAKAQPMPKTVAKGKPQLEGTLTMQPVQQASAELPALPKSSFPTR